MHNLSIALAAKLPAAKQESFAYYKPAGRKLPADSKALLQAPRVAIYNWSIKHGVTYTLAYALHDEQGNVLVYTDDCIVKIVAYSRITDIRKDGKIGTSRNWKTKLASASNSIKAEWIDGLDLNGDS